MRSTLTGYFSPAGFLQFPRYAHCGVPIAGLGVLVIAGFQAAPGSSARLAGVELYLQASGQWSARSPLPVTRDACSAVLLASSRVLVAGGSAGGYAIADSQVYDVSADSWGATGPMITPRFGHSLTLLDSSEVLAVGGNNLTSSGGQVQDSVELYDPLIGRWHRQGWLPVDCMNHTATLLQGAGVLVVGGYSGRLNRALDQAFRYDTSNGQWTPVQPLPVPIMQHTATLLQDGRVLVAGGTNAPFDVPTNQAFVYDPRLDRWDQTAMCVPRKGHSATRLVNGEVLVVGASSLSDPANAWTAEVFDPQLEQWALVASLQQGRFDHSASSLSTGQVLIAGGSAPTPHPSPVPGAELFTLTADTRPG